MHSSSEPGNSLTDKFKKAFHVGGNGKKERAEDIQPLGHGAHGHPSPVRL